MVTTLEMQSIPSLIGVGTAVAAATTGLVFGQLAEGEQLEFPHVSPGSSMRKPITDHDSSSPLSLSRPGTSSASSTAPPPLVRGQTVPSLRLSTVPVPPSNATSAQARIPRRASHAHITQTKGTAARRTMAKQTDLVMASSIAEDSRDSVSSNGSWIRRLSLRPMSQHGSLRSSIGPDSPSIFSFGSAAPILSTSQDSLPQLPPNKLVKRAPGVNVEDAGLTKRRGSRTQMTLRRPATSHQRSATLQHQLVTEDVAPGPKFSFEQRSRPRANTVGTRELNLGSRPVGNERSWWKSFWHSKLSHNTLKSTPLRGIDGSSQPVDKRIHLDSQLRPVYLVTPDELRMDEYPEKANGVVQLSDSQPPTNSEDISKSTEKNMDSTEVLTPSKQPKRSASLQFSSPTSWISKTGSLRRRKRASETPGGNKSHISVPMANSADAISPKDDINTESILKGAEVSQAEAHLAAIFRPLGTKRDPPSPLPPLSRFSTFHVDMNRLDSSPLASPDQSDDAVTSLTISSKLISHSSYARTLERASTVGSSEYHRGFTSGDEDDADSKTDTPYDSFRTVASGRKHSLDGPLDMVFDDSPPSTAGNSNMPKRLSIQEILGPSFDGGHKIMEEDESTPTPIRGTYEEFEARFRSASIDDDGMSLRGHITPSFPIEKDYSRLSLDDDDDLEWAKENEMGIYNHLSPPSSMNSRRGSPNFHTKSGRMHDNEQSDAHFDSVSERPRSTIFDWAEPPVHDRRENNGVVNRPKTVHGKHELDMRGGRSASRKGPMAAHIRSQSVPVVPDLIQTAKTAPKFGTWGLGQKNISEDWDDDFEFEEDTGSGTGMAGKEDENRFSMLVPASIQATQPTVRAHSGQIRELSLLVNDLKRLCRLGREMNMLNSLSTKLWHEAEGIIALASPDEETEEAGGTKTTDGIDSNSVDERYLEQGFDGSTLDVLQTPRQQKAPSSRRRSVFSPEDDIFGTWDHADSGNEGDRPRTPENTAMEPRSTSVARSVMESMRMRHITFDSDVEDDVDADEQSDGKLNFDTNSLKELVKRAGDLRDSLSELVRREDHITQSPARTPRHALRPDGSPAFTRVFDDPSSSPTRRLPSNHNKPGVGTTSPSSNGMSRRMQLMTVS